MHIKSLEFAGAVGQIGQAEPATVEGLPQIAFAGRSNVGKSSLINRVLGRTRTPIARVSQQPGKTQEINFYRVRADAGEFCLVDLPGYGYAKAPEALRKRWRPLINGYLTGNPALLGVVHLVDLRHGPTDDDRRALEFLASHEIPVLFALTKADKLRPVQRAKQVAKVLEILGVHSDQAVPVSSLSGDGVETLRDTLGELLAAAGGGAASGDGDGAEPVEGEEPDMRAGS